MVKPTEDIESHLFGGLAHAVGSNKSVEAGVWSLALLDQQRAVVVGNHLVDVFVILDLRLVLWLVGRGLEPGEGGEGTAMDGGPDVDV